MARLIDANLVSIPCKIGDTVWALKRCYNGYSRPFETIVSQMYFDDDMRLCIVAKGICRGEWGKRIFATKEEAEAAIRKENEHGLLQSAPT